MMELLPADSFHLISKSALVKYLRPTGYDVPASDYASCSFEEKAHLDLGRS